VTTNVRPEDLNYSHYSTRKYDQDIARSIPGHKELHKKIGQVLKAEFDSRSIKVLELGIGTGLTAKSILKHFPKAEYAGIDFSRQMLDGARKKLSKYRPTLILGDYAIKDFPKNNDLIVSVIGVHHQKTDKDKKALFKKIFAALAPKGIFIFGDLVSFRNRKTAALNEALHFHALVENAKSKKSLAEWAFHHKFLNNPAPLEDQLGWLKQIGFENSVMFQKFNTALVICRKKKRPA